MGVTEQSRRGVAEHCVRLLLVSIRSFTDREVSFLTLVALTAKDGERNDDAFAFLQVAVNTFAYLNDFAHELVAQDVALLHPDHEMIVQMEIAPADGAARYFDDGVARMLNFRIRYILHPQILFAIPP